MKNKAVITLLATAFLLSGCSNGSIIKDIQESAVDINSNIRERVSTEAYEIESNASSILQEETASTEQATNIAAEQQLAENKASANELYLEKLKNLTELYGSSGYVTKENDGDDMFTKNKYLTGLCYAKLIDFDNDGSNELIVGYRDPSKNSEERFDQQYNIEVWSFDGNDLKKIYDSMALGNAWEGLAFYILQIDGQYYIYSYKEIDSGTNENTGESKFTYIREAYGIHNGDHIFSVCHSQEDSQYISASLDIRNEYFVDGKEVTYDEFQNAAQEWIYVKEYGFQNCNDELLNRSLMSLNNTWDILNGIDIDNNDVTIPSTEGQADILGLWNTSAADPAQMQVAITFYKDKTVGISERDGFYWGTYTTNDDDSIDVYLHYAIKYDNISVTWTQNTMDCKIILSPGNNKEQMIFTQEYDNIGNHFLGNSEVTVTRVHNENEVYDSVNPIVEEYKNKL